MKLIDFRKDYPEYNDVPDDLLVEAFHQEYYPDIDKDTFYKEIGFTPAFDYKLPAGTLPIDRTPMAKPAPAATGQITAAEEQYLKTGDTPPQTPEIQRAHSTAPPLELQTSRESAAPPEGGKAFSPTEFLKAGQEYDVRGFVPLIAKPRDGLRATTYDANTLKMAGESYDLGKVATRLGQLSAAIRDGKATPEMLAERNRLRAALKKERQYNPRNLLERAIASAANIAPSLVGSTAAGARGAAEGGAAGAAAGAIAGSPTGPGAGITAATGAAGGAAVGATSRAFEYSMQVEGGLAYDEYLEAGIPEDIAGPASQVVGVINGSLDVIGIGFVLKMMPGANKAISYATRQAVKAAVATSAVKQAFKAYATGVGGETVTETMQEASTIVGREVGAKVSNALRGTDIPPLQQEDIAKRLTATAVETLLGMAVMGAPATGVKVMSSVATTPAPQDAAAPGTETPQQTEPAGPTAPTVPVPAHAKQFVPIVQQAAAKHGVDPNLVAAVINTESRWNPKAGSSAGAQGLMQLMPGTARDLGVADPFDPKQNVEGGTKYLAMLLKRYKGDVAKALAAYNWGPGRVPIEGPLPSKMPAETRAYLKAVLGEYRASEGAALPAETSIEDELVPRETPAPETAQEAPGATTAQPAQTPAQETNAPQEPAGKATAPKTEPTAKPVEVSQPLTPQQSAAVAKVPVEIFDRRAGLDRITAKLEDPKDQARVKEDGLDDRLGDYGVTKKTDFSRALRELDAAGIPYSLEAADGGNLGGLNKFRGTHEQADEDMRAVWGDVYVREVQNNGGMIFRTGGDEFRVIWPNRSVEQANQIRAAIETKIRQAAAARGLENIPHPKHDGLPTGAMHTSYGITEGTPGKYGQMDRLADERAEVMALEEMLAKAKKEGYHYDQKEKVFRKGKPDEQRGETEKAGPAGEDAGGRGTEISGAPREGSGRETEGGRTAAGTQETDQVKEEPPGKETPPKKEQTKPAKPKAASDLEAGILSAWQTVKARDGFSDVHIIDLYDELAKTTKLTLPEFKAFLKRLSKDNKAVLSLGDWSLSDERVRSGAVTLPGLGNYKDTGRRNLLVRLKPDNMKAKPAEAAPKPNEVRTVPTESLSINPSELQWKRNVGEKGVSSKLKSESVRYNPTLGGIILVWYNAADGKTYVVNGHHRYDLAVRSGEKEITARYIKAESFKEARAIGALANIAEDQGTAEDAALVFRSLGITTEDIEKTTGVPLTGKVAREGLALSGLHPSLFGMIEKDQMPRSWGLVIGDRLAGQFDAQLQLVKHLFKKNKGAAATFVEQMIQEMTDGAKVSEVQTDMFGTKAFERPLLAERAELREYAVKRLSADKKLFGTVSDAGRAKRLEEIGNKIDIEKSRKIADEAAMVREILDKLGSRAGQISDTINRYAQELVDAKDKPARDEIKQRFVSELREAVADVIGNREKKSAANPGKDEGRGGNKAGGVGSGGLFSSGRFADIPLAMEMPEIVQLAKELLGGKYPKIMRRMKEGVQGRFITSGKIQLAADVFQDWQQAAKVLAHEVGHLIDWLDEKTIKRGNILGRIASLRKFMGTWLPNYPGGPGPLTKADYARLKAEAKQLAVKTREIEIDEEITQTTGLTPQDILSIWNSVQNGLPKDLLDFVKRMTDAEKKSVAKQAMKGLLPKELAGFVKTVKIKTGKKIKQTIIEQAPFMKRFQQLVEDEIKRRRLFSRLDIDKELRRFTHAWKPFDATKDKAYTKYRYSSVELYADALSALITNPAYIKREAPIFYEAFFNWIGEKPEVKKVWDAIQDDIRMGRNKGKREERMTDAWRKEEERKFAEVQKRANPLTNKSQALAEIFDNFSSVLKVTGRFGKENLSPEMNPRFAVEHLEHIGTVHEAFLTAIVQRVTKTLEKINANHEDFGKYLFFRRAATERSELANPWGFDEASAFDHMTAMEKKFGPELKAAAKEFWAVWKEFVVEAVEEEQMHRPAAIKKISNNKVYATFDVLKDDEDAYGSFVSGHIYRQYGTLSEIANPFTATIIKGIAIQQAIAKNKAARLTANVMQSKSPKEIQPAKMVYSQDRKGLIPLAPKDPDKGLLVYLDHGEVVGFWVPKPMAEAFQKNPYAGQWFSKFLHFMAQPFRTVFTEANPGFWAANLIRDFDRSVINLPKKGAAKYIPIYDALAFLPYYLSGAKDVLTKAPIVQEMQKAGEFVPATNFWGARSEEQELERMLVSHGIRPSKLNNRVLKPFQTFWQFWTGIGSNIERFSKVGGEKYLRAKFPDMPDEVRAHIVRSWIGSPDFLRRGRAMPIVNNIMLYSNAMKEGWRADIEVLRDRPVEIIWKRTFYSVLPKLIMLAIGMGLLGDELKELMDQVSDYDKANYTVVPLGKSSNGKAVVLRIPQDETGRFYGGLVWKLLNARSADNFMEIAGYAGGQIPTVAPWMTLMVDTVDFMQGRSPYDNFRGKPGIPELVMEAGGKRKYEAFAKYVWDQMGGGIIYNFGSDKPAQIKGELEEVLGYPIVSNVVGRFIKVTDQGLREELDKALLDLRSQQAEDTLLAREAVAKILQNQPLNDDEMKAIAAKGDNFAYYIEKGLTYYYGDVFFQSYQAARNKAEKLVILKKMQEYK